MNSSCVQLRAAPAPVSASSLELCMPVAGVRAGFPSPAEDFTVNRLDLTAILITHPQASYILRVVGDSMRDAGILDGDLMVVNRAIKPKHRHVVVAVVDGDFTVKYLDRCDGGVCLKAANPAFPDIIPKDGQTIEIWGVVTSSTTRFLI